MRVPSPLPAIMSTEFAATLSRGNKNSSDGFVGRTASPGMRDLEQNGT